MATVATVLSRQQSADDDRCDRRDARTKSSAMLVGARVVGRPPVRTEDPTAVLRRRDLPMRGIRLAPARAGDFVPGQWAIDSAHLCFSRGGTRESTAVPAAALHVGPTPQRRRIIHKGWHGFGFVSWFLVFVACGWLWQCQRTEIWHYTVEVLSRPLNGVSSSNQVWENCLDNIYKTGLEVSFLTSQREQLCAIKFCDLFYVVQ